MSPNSKPTSPVLHVLDNHADSDQLLALCKASGDALRLNILRVLSKDSFGVLELCQILDCKQSGMSHHLKILSKAGLVTTRREGNSIFYRRSLHASRDNLNGLQRSLLNSIDQLALSEDTQKQVEAIQAERTERSKEFFAENADKFQQQQEQVADYSLYGHHALELIKRSFPKTDAKVLEVGPGEGMFLTELSPRFQQIYALDNSDAMLAKARNLITEKGLENIHFIHGDTKSCKLGRESFDCAVVNMVLHHIPSPADIFQDLAKVLKTRGQLLITDLCHHDQNWVREACGDLWLGFEPEDIEQWASDAGLQEKESMYLAQRNGFRVQIRQFEKI
jgi:ArsR family transcriptional regulator